MKDRDKENSREISFLAKFNSLHKSTQSNQSSRSKSSSQGKTEKVKKSSFKLPTTSRQQSILQSWKSRNT